MHGLKNNFLYSAKMIIAKWSNGKDTVELRGTGFFIEKDQEVSFITNRHVVEPGYSDKRYINYKILSMHVYGHQTIDAQGLPQDYHIADIENFSDFIFAKNYYDDVACLKNVRLAPFFQKLEQYFY